MSALHPPRLRWPAFIIHALLSVLIDFAARALYGPELGDSGVRAFVKQPVAVISRHKLLIAVLACRYDARRGLATKDRIFGVAERAAEVRNW